jgi:hypothetical protein
MKQRSRRMDDAIVASLVTNPRILRQLPRLLKQAGFVMETIIPSVHHGGWSGRFLEERD